MSLFDRIIRNAYYRTYAQKGLKLPKYINIGKYVLCFYAMDMDFKSLRIKLEKNNEIIFVIKKGIY